MLTPPCPNCEWSHPRLVDLSGRPALKYYRCGSCGHTWTAGKDASDLPQFTASARPARAMLPGDVKRRAKA
jgi:hypothetical protein